MSKDGGRFRGHGVALAWPDEAEYQQLRAIERELLANPALFREQHGVWLSLTGASLHDLAVARLRESGARGPVKMGEATNLLMTQGAADFWTALTGAAITGGYYNAANSNLGVGDSAVAPTVAQVDLQAAVNKLRVGMDGGFPTLATNTAQFRMSTAAAQYIWKEWALFNANAGGHMLNRAVPAGTLGDKTGVGATWQLLVTLSLV